MIEKPTAKASRICFECGGDIRGFPARKPGDKHRILAMIPGMTRDHLLAAEIFSYSFDNYAGHLGIEHLRFEVLMPDTARKLERAEKEGWTDERLCQAIKVELSELPEWRKRYRDAVEVVDAKSPAESFRCAVRQSLVFEFRQHPIGDAEIESAVKQICYRAADLSYLLDQSREKLSDYSKELRREDDELDTDSDQEV